MNHVLSLSKIEDDYMPIAVMLVKAESGSAFWQVENDVPGNKDLEEFTMWLFDDLIDRTKEELARDFENEPIVIAGNEPQLDYVFDIKTAWY